VRDQRRVDTAWAARVRAALPLGLAVATHALIVIAVYVDGLRARPVDARVPAAVEQAPRAEVEVEVEAPYGADEPRSASAADTRLAAATAATAPAASGGAPRPNTRPNPGAGGETFDGAIAAPTGTSDDAALESPGAATSTFRPTKGVDVGLGNRAGLAGLAEGTDAPPGRTGPRPASSTGGLVEALDAADMARGLGHGGPVRTAVDEAARLPEAPTFGSATFAVALGTDGSVKVSVVAASGDRTRWDSLGPAVRDTLLRASHRKALKGNGVLVTVKVDASEQFPGGGRPTPDSKQGLGARASAGGVTETKDRVDIELPSASVGYRTRSCDVGVAVSLGGVSLGGGCAPGVAMRVVATQILSEQRL